MKKWAKFTCLMLAMLLVLTALPTFAAVPAAAAETDSEGAQKAYKDYVLLLDCSASLIFNDPKDLCMAACKRFIDTLPIEDARVSVIAFGYEGAAFPYEAYAAELELKEDVNFVHEIVPMDVLDTTEKKNDCKRIMENTITNSRKNGATTPIGHALLAAVEVLERSNSAAGDACVILVSDGVNEPSTINQDPEIAEFASKKAGEKGWPIYSVHLAPTKASENAKLMNPAPRDPVDLLNEISKNSGDRKVGRVGCETPEEVVNALKEIVDDFNDKPHPEPTPVTLPGSYEFDVKDLTSELTIDITGENIEMVKLTYLDGTDKPEEYHQSEDKGHRLVVKEQYYFMIKMIVPKAGNWRLDIYGDTNAVVEVYEDGVREMGFSVVATPSSKKTPLIKTNTIDVRATFQYRNLLTPDTGFYGEHPATLNVLSADKKTVIKSVPCDPAKTDENGYYWNLTLDGIPEGEFHLQAVLEHDLFRGGKKVSNVASFALQNLEIKLIKFDPMKLDGFVNNTFPKIDLSTVFENPDGDPVTYELICDDRDVKFAYAVSEDGYMSIITGMNPGTYEMSITAIDEDMKKAGKSPVVYDQLTLVVENRDPVIKEEMHEQELWLDYYSFQEPGMLELNLDLNQFFEDPDFTDASCVDKNLALTYSVAVSADNVVQAQVSDNVLQVIPAMEEEVIVTVTASDGLSEVKQEFTVEVVSGKDIFWAENWIWFALAAAAIIFILIVIAVIRGNIRVKGEWNIKVSDGTKECSFERLNIRSSTKAGRSKKGKFAVVEVLSEIASYMNGDSKLRDAFVATLQSSPAVMGIMMKGVTAKKGCKICGIPKDNTGVTVTYKYVARKKPFNVTNGSFVIVYRKPDGSHLDITMELL